MSRSGTTLYVTGFGHGTRARDLAYEFEQYVDSSQSHLLLPRLNLITTYSNPLSSILC
jgi:hypothetical protein